MMMEMNQLAKQIFEASHLKGTFTLRSGKRSEQYFDTYLFEANPSILRNIGRKLAAFIPAETEVIAGLEMGGIPIATALSLECGIPAAFVRRRAKDYGTQKLAEGSPIEGKRVCIIEDVVTTAGQIMLSTTALREAGAEVKHVLCVIERSREGRENLEKQGVTLHSLFTIEELIEAGQ
jgi:orotate phosphoribosyltransferase